MIADFYKDCEIFITGGSGVVGKAAIEKLLRSCDVKKIYMLIRCKKGISPEERLERIKNSRIFEVLEKTKPNEMDKLVAIPGDTSQDGFGISQQHRELMKNVSVIFHSAATTRFNEPLKVAIRLNVKSTNEALKLAETFRNLKIFIHLSTFFSNPYLDYVQDKVYPTVFDWRTALQLLDTEYDGLDFELNAFTEKFISGFPNTYSFTKHVTEKLVDDYRTKLPVAIFRPSIGSMEEPAPGFSESTNGVMGLFLVWGAGLMHVNLCTKDIIPDFTPLDIGTKVLLAFTAKSAQLEREKFEKATPVGMFSSHGILKHNMEQMVKCCVKAFEETPYEKSIMIPNVMLTASPFVFTFFTILLQLFPAALFDMILRLAGRKPFFMQIQRKIYITAKITSFFQAKEYKSDGTTDLEELLEKEKGTDFDISAFKYYCNGDENYEKIIKLTAAGCRKYLLNEDESTLPRCRKILKAKKIVSGLIKLVLLYFIGCAVYRRAMS